MSYQVSKTSNVPYVSGGHPSQKMDIYRPVGLSGKLPTVMLINGGSWITANEDTPEPLARYLASLGYTTMSMRYRVTPEGFYYPSQISDIKSAFNYANTTNYVNGARMMAWGWSAGSFGAAWLAADNKKIKCAILECGPLNLGDGSHPAVAGMLNGYDPQAASPVNAIDVDSRPTMLVYGLADTTTPLFIGEEWKAKYDALGLSCVLRTHSGDHGPAEGAEYNTILAEQVAWIAANL